MSVSLIRARSVPTTAHRSRRGPAALVAVVLALAGAVLAIEPAAAAGASPLLIDDFVGPVSNRTAATNFTTVTDSPTGTHVAIAGGDPNSMHYVQYTWTFDTPIDLTQGGATQLEMEYANAAGVSSTGEVLSNPLMLAVYVTDTSGRQKSRGGTGVIYGSGTFVTNFTQQGLTDSRYLMGSGDLKSVHSIALYVGTSTGSNVASVDLKRFSAVVNESAFTMPGLPAPSSITARRGTPIDQTITATGFPGPTVTVARTTAGAAPDGVTVAVSGHSVVFSGTPTRTGSWTYTITAKTLADLPAATTTVTLNVFTPPTVAATSSFTASTGRWFNQDIAVTGDPAPTATFSPDLPAGLTGTISRTGRALTISGAPTGTPGLYTGTVTVDNGFATAQGALSIAVQGRATLPALSDAVVAVGAEITPIEITGGGYPTPDVTVGGLPTGLVATPTTGGTRITGTPTTTGTSSVTVTADNSAGLPVSRAFDLTVASVPTISAPTPIAATVGVYLRVPVTVTGYPAPSAAAVGPGLPAGLTLSKDFRGEWAIRGVPTSEGMGSTVVTLQADNPLSSATTTVAVVVSGAPTITGPTTLDLSRGAVMAPVTFAGAGYPPPLMTLKAGQTLPDGLETANTPGTFTLSGTPTQTGVTDLTVVAQNAIGTVERTVRVTVGTEPVFADETRTITVREGQRVSEVFEAASYPAASFTVSPGALPRGLSLTTDGILTGIPNTGSADAGSGSYALTVRATNGFGSDTQAVTIVVRSTPTFPAGLPTATFAAGTASSYGFTVGGWDRPTPSLLDPLPAGLSLTDAGDTDPTTWAITGTVARELMGPHSVRIALNNATGMRTTRTLSIEVTADFQWEIPTRTLIVEQGRPMSAVEVTGTGYPMPGDYSHLSEPRWLQCDDAGSVGSPRATSVVFQCVGTPPRVGSSTLSLAPDWAGPKPVVSVTFDVKNRPVLTAPAARTVVAGDAVNISVTATGTPTIGVTEAGLPAGLSFGPDGAGRWRVTGTVDRAAVGTHTVTLTADNGLVATRTLTLTVESAPVVDDATVITTLGTAATGVVHATGSPVPRLAVTVGDLPPGLSAADDGAGGLAFTGTPTTPGSWAVTVTATNGHGADTAVVTVEVRSVPVFTRATIEETLREGTPVDLTATTTGFPAATVEIASGTLPAGLTLSPDGRLTGTLAAGSADSGSGRYNLTLRAWNSMGENTVPVILTVLSAPSFPAGLPTMSIDADTAASYTFTTGGWDRPTATLLDPLPAGLSLAKVDDTTWQITGSVARALRGPYSVRVALDNSFGRVVQSLQIEVSAPLVWGEAPSTIVVETRKPITPLTITSTGYAMPNNYGVSERPSWISWPWYSFGPTEFAVRFEGTPTVAGPARLTLTPWGVPGPDITVIFLVTDRPVITAPASVTAPAGDPLAVDVSVAGSPTAHLTETGLPDSLSLVPGTTAGTWQITGTPGRDALGEHAVTLTADNGLTSTLDLTLTVTGGALLTTPTQAITMRLGEPMPAVTWTATGYPAPDLELIGDLPPGVVATAGPGGLTLDGTPTTQGTWTVDVRTTNAHGTDVVTVYIVVADLPAFADETVDLVMIEGVPTTTTLPLRGFPEPAVDVVGAIPGLTVTHTPGSDPILSGTPAAGSAGDYVLTLTARNTIAGVEQTDVVTVNVRVDAPAAITSGTDALVTTVGTAVDRTIRVGGAPEATLTAAGLPAGLTLARTAAGEWHLTGTPAAGTGGIHPVTLTATNGVLDPATATLQVTVREPVIAVRTPAAALRVGTAGSITVTTTGGWPTPPALRIEGALPRGLSFVDDGNGTGRVVGTPAAGTAGGWTVTVLADNGVGVTRTSLTFIVIGRPVATGAARGAGTTAGDGTQAGPGTAAGDDAGAGDASGAGTGDTAGDGSGTSADDGGDAAVDEPPVIDVPVTVTGPGANPWWWALASLLVILTGTAAMVYRRLRGR